MFDRICLWSHLALNFVYKECFYYIFNFIFSYWSIQLIYSFFFFFFFLFSHCTARGIKLSLHVYISITFWFVNHCTRAGTPWSNSSWFSFGGCKSLESCPFLLGCQICWYIIVHNSLLFIYFFVFLQHPLRFLFHFLFCLFGFFLSSSWWV